MARSHEFFRIILTLPHPSAIHSPLGNAEAEGDACIGGFIDKQVTKSCRSAQPKRQNYILFERFQIALPPVGIGIILRANWHRPG
jgi:hypothetical protein